MGRYRWAVAAVFGAVIGSGVAIATFDRLLRALARGRQIAVFDLDEPFQKQAQFVVAMALCGAVVGCCALSAGRWAGWRSVAARGLGFATCFTAAAGVAFFYLRSRWNPEHGIPGIGMSPQLSLASAPLVTPLVVGVAAVLVVLGLVALRRVPSRLAT